jgi:glycosyltransferase involved in cell wall biosynthesis
LKFPGKIDGREIRGVLIKYIVSVNRWRNEPSMYYADLKEIDYDGYVYCATVTNHAMLVERNGKVIFSGNTERKHPLALIKAYWYAFQNDENAALVLKTYRNDYSDKEKDAIRTTINRLKNVTPSPNGKYARIYLISNMLTREEILGLHKRGDCYASLDRGEGFGLGPFESAAAGNPIIVTGFGGVTEFAKPDNSYLVNHVLTPCFGMPYSPWYTFDQAWAEPDIIHGAELMHHVYENRKEASKKGKKLQKYIADNFSWEDIGKKIIKEIEEI